MRKCGTCKGSGLVKPQKIGGGWMFAQKVVKCCTCHGKGSRS